jgi:protein-disulfide isomerase
MLIPLFDSNRDNYAGSVHASVELMEYGDYQCTFCAEAYQVVEAIRQALGDDLRYVFRNFPLPNVHTNAIEAAVAAEAAARQGKFWQMHNSILENQKFLTRASYGRFAEEIGVDLAEFERDRNNQEVFAKITGDLESGVKSGVNGTPTFFVNGLRYNGFTDFKSLYHTCLYVKRYSATGS